MTTLPEGPRESYGLVGAIVEKFLNARLSVIFILASVIIGIGVVMITPREEEPQIVVPLADVYVRFPGANATEVEQKIAVPLEKLLWQIDGVEHVYSVSRRDAAVVTVRFFVGENRENSLVKLYNKINSHVDEAAPGITGWVIKPVEIDDVPIVNLTLYSSKYDDHVLRRVGEELLTRLNAVPDVSRSEIVGGRRLQARVELDPELLAGANLSPLEVVNALKSADAALSAGTFPRQNKLIAVKCGPFLNSVNDLKRLVISARDARPIYLSDVAKVSEAPAEQESYTRIGFGPADDSVSKNENSLPAVTIGISKKKGTNAVFVAENVLAKLEELKPSVIPEGIDVKVTRNYGETANNKVNDLLEALMLAVLTVVCLLLLTMGWRESLVVALSVPVSFALSLFVNYLFGYTINRVTLFALILSLGLVVDDPIVNVDNIQRHIRAKLRPARNATLYAVHEVLPPVIVSSLTIIMAFLPMFFITGMMGPYMEPMAINVPLTVTFSTVCALTFVPWLAYTLIKNRKWTAPVEIAGVEKPGLVARIYRFVVEPFLKSRLKAGMLIGAIMFLLLISGLLAVTGRVPLKMLPFDNKNELQLVLDLPEGTTLETTDKAVRAFENYLRTVPEITNFTSYAGTSSPMDFNGMVRHYYFRQQPNTADIRINLADKKKRVQQSHAICLRLRNDLQKLAKEQNVNLKIVESPPGPPVISTLTVEIYGEPSTPYQALIDSAQVVQNRMALEEGVVDIDNSSETPRARLDFVLDAEKAKLNGINADAVVNSMALALSGFESATVHKEGERNPLLVSVRLPYAERASQQRLERLSVKGDTGRLVQLAEIGEFREVPEDQSIYHKDNKQVVYVFAEMAGRAPAEAVINLYDHFQKNPLAKDQQLVWAGEGEWDITVRVFRDLGIAFGVALLGIFILLVFETSSLVIPLIIMLAIPLTAIGIMPGFYLMNLLTNVPIGGYSDPVFFTATAMIGMIALGGIVVRNSIVLIEFIHQDVAQGKSLYDAILRSGAVRFRPIVLTAAATALGAWPITLDPIFSGLAWSLIFGIFASTIFTLIIVPVVYYLIYGRKSPAPTTG